MSDPEVHLIERLRQAPPFEEGVSFVEVEREVTRRRGRRAVGALGGGVAVVALGLGVVSGVLGGLRPGGDSSLASAASGSSPVVPARPTEFEVRTWSYPVELCPDSVVTDPDVPALASGGVGEAFVASRQLVPTAIPVSAVMCTYQIVSFATNGGAIPPSGSTHGLFSAVQLRSGLDRLARDLSGLSQPLRTTRACTLIAGEVDVVLLRLDYAQGGTVWVKAQTDANRCTPTTNGSFVTDWYGGDAFQAAASEGTWPGLESASQAPRPTTPRS